MSQLRVCIMGSGAAGMSLAKSLLDAFPGISLQIFEKSVQPFGLVCSAIAPDRRALKNIQKSFLRTLAHPSVSATLCTDPLSRVPHSALLAHFSAVFLATGAEEKSLDSVDVSLNGVIRGLLFHSWLNHQPQAPANLLPIHETETVNILGNGNAALDIARFLLTPPSSYAGVPWLHPDVQQQLISSAVRRVRIFARKPPTRPAYSLSLLQELLSNRAMSLHLDEADFEGLSAPAGDRAARALWETYSTASGCALPHADEIRAEPPSSDRRSLELHFLHSDLQCLGDARNESLRALSFVHSSPDGRRAQKVTFPANNIILSLGFRTLFPNDAGRVRGRERCYCAGWSHTDGKGDLGETRRSVRSVVALFQKDVENGLISPPLQPLSQTEFLSRYGLEGAVPWSEARQGFMKDPL